MASHAGGIGDIRIVVRLGHQVCAGPHVAIARSFLVSFGIPSLSKRNQKVAAGGLVLTLALGFRSRSARNLIARADYGMMLSACSARTAAVLADGAEFYFGSALCKEVSLVLKAFLRPQLRPLLLPSIYLSCYASAFRPRCSHRQGIERPLTMAAITLPNARLIQILTGLQGGCSETLLVQPSRFVGGLGKRPRKLRDDMFVASCTRPRCGMSPECHILSEESSCLGAQWLIPAVAAVPASRLLRR